MVLQLIVALSWLLLPVAVVSVIDDWFFRPRRRLAAHPDLPWEPFWLRTVHGVMPVLVVAGVLRLFVSQEPIDFGLVLVLVAVISGVVSGVDRWVLRPRREAALSAAGKPSIACPEPVVVDYARSFFPVALGVLVLRSFLWEPFRIPSDSMMPTLLDGDFILVNKFAYGLRLPVTNAKILALGTPERGDVVVFKYPPDPRQNYIKRLVGLPGDRVRIINDRLYVNGEPITFEPAGRYDDGCYSGMQRAVETIGSHRHEVLHCVGMADLSVPRPQACNRRIDRGYQCEPSVAGFSDRNDTPEVEVPAGHYLMIGDNRDNSADSRYFGFVPEANLLGKAQLIWFNWDLQRSGGPAWSRIGKQID